MTPPLISQILQALLVGCQRLDCSEADDVSLGNVFVLTLAAGFAGCDLCTLELLGEALPLKGSFAASDFEIFCALLKDLSMLTSFALNICFVFRKHI